MKKIIKLNTAELQNRSSRVVWAEGLILQLPKEHEGRCSWLLNYGIREEAQEFRASDDKRREEKGYTSRNLIWDEETDSLRPC